MRILFIGNSHTYVNDMPEIVARLAKKDGIDCEVVMIAHGGWFCMGTMIMWCSRSMRIRLDRKEKCFRQLRRSADGFMRRKARLWHT